MKRSLFLFFFLLPLLSLAAQNQKPRVIILATGGTIAGSAAGSTQASYTPGVISIDQIIATVPDLKNVADLKGIQICNISSQNMEPAIWFRLFNVIDSLFTNDLCDGVVVTHGTDTMEETAYFLNLTVKHRRPVVLTGSMRPFTSLSADGPFNLFNAVSLAASPQAAGRGVMVTMNDYIFSADDVTKSNSVNTMAFSSPNLGPLGYMRDGKPRFYRESLSRHTFNSEFDIRGLKSLPDVEIILSYAFTSNVAIKAVINAGARGVVIAGVGHGNYNREIASELEWGYSRGVRFVRSTRVVSGGVDMAAEEFDSKYPVAFLKSPQKARILLMLALTKTNDSAEIQRIFEEY